MAWVPPLCSPPRWTAVVWQVEDVTADDWARLPEEMAERLDIQPHGSDDE